jgi:signal transduction histidine kinase
MFSDEQAIALDVADRDLSAADLQARLRDAAESHECVASLLVRIDDAGPVVEVADRLADEPLHGKLRPVVARLLEECTSNFPSAHVQSVPPSPIDQLKAVNPRVPLKYRVVFIPYLARDLRLAFIGFLSESAAKAMPQGLAEAVAGVAQLVALRFAIGDTTDRLRTLERYVKEAGHDISSAVQASVAKLRNIARGVIPESVFRAKAKEAEEEILNAHRVAANLGFVADPDYNIGNGTVFDFVEAARRVMVQYRAEATERELELTFDAKTHRIDVWGDQQAIESAVGHFLSNAIKYSLPGGFITIGVWRAADFAGVSVTDRGIPVKPEDRERIWSFGYRGADALELHVNGSGIGLFSVRKIVNAHGGSAEGRWESNDPRVATFSFKIPIGRVLDKTQLLRPRK